MLLTITNRTPEATDLGYLLHKHPARYHKMSLPFGEGSIFYSRAEPAICTAVLLVEVDSVGLVRGRGARQGGWSLGQYVNDRPYAANSFLTTAVSRMLGTALNGNCKNRPELVEKRLDLEVRVPVLPAPGGSEMLERLFRPLGYEIHSSPLPLDPAFPAWGESRYRDATIRQEIALKDLLRHLFVLIPALDRDKHYWVGPEEIEKLLSKGEKWLGNHPEKEWITTRFLKFQRGLAREALQRLAPDLEDETQGGEVSGEPEAERRISLHTQRLDRVVDLVAALNPSSVTDLGCGEGKLLLRLLNRTNIPRITGMDVDTRSLSFARERLERKLVPHQREGRLELLHGSLIYRDQRLAGYDVACLVEVIEHLDPARLRALEEVVFGAAAPRTIIVTTPNREYNILFEGMTPGTLRHRDHRFEWTRSECGAWAQRVADEFHYDVTLEPLGEEDPTHGAPSQLVTFTRKD